MQALLKLVALVAIIFAGIFGYFLSQNSWDFTLTKSVVSYELNKLMGDASEKLPVLEDEAQEDKVASDTSMPTHSKDSIYEDKGNSFSDMKRTGNESEYQRKD